VKWLTFITSKTLNFPSPTCGRGSPAGAGEGALAGKSTLSLTLSHQWERGQLPRFSHFLVFEILFKLVAGA
jgi:hypothetical protein